MIRYPYFRPVVVDNGSSDGSEEIIRRHFPDFELLQTGSNLGFAGGNNVGIRHALDSGADYVWLLNNDTTVAPDSLSELVRRAESDPAVGMVGSKIFFHNRPNKLWSTGGFWSRDGANLEQRGFDQEDEGQYDEPCTVDFLTGCSMLVKAELIRYIGLMREDYFLYWEDADWSRSAIEHGWKLYYAPGSKVWHKVSASVTNRSQRQWYYFTRNACLFIERHVRSRLFSHLVNHQGYYLRTALHNKDRVAVNGIITGLLDYFLRRFGARPS